MTVFTVLAMWLLDTPFRGSVYRSFLCFDRLYVTRHFEEVCFEVFSVSIDCYVTGHFEEVCSEVFSVSIDCYMKRHSEEVCFEACFVLIHCDDHHSLINGGQRRTIFSNIGVFKKYSIVILF